MKTTYKILYLKNAQAEAELIEKEFTKSHLSFEQKIVDTEKEFLDVLDQFLPDVVLCEHLLSSYNSVNALKAVKAKNLFLPFILITSLLTEDAGVKAMKDGADDYIVKDSLKRVPFAVINAAEKYRLKTERKQLVEENKRLRNILNNSVDGVASVAREAGEKKLADAQLQLSELRFKDLVQGGSDLIVILNEQGDYLYVSPNSKDILGYAYEEFIGKNTFSFIHPDDKEIALTSFSKIADVRKITVPLIRFSHKDGSWRWLDSSVTNLMDNPSIKGIVVNARDITDRKLAQDGIRESEARLAAAQSVAKVGSWQTDLRTLEVVWSIETYRIFDMPDEMKAISHETFLNFTHPDDRAKVNAAFVESCSIYTNRNIEHRVITFTGNVKMVEERWRIITDEKGKPVSAVGTIQDITERKNTEQILVESEAKYRAFFENSIDGILLTEPNGKVFSANPAACAIFGMTEEEICSAGRLALVDASDVRVEDLLKERQRNGRAKGEITYKRKDGSTFPGETASVIFTDLHGRERTSMIIRDTTERKKSEQKLKDSEERYRTLFEQNLAGFYQTNKAGVILDCNEAFVKMLKYDSVKELLSINSKELYFSVDDRDHFIKNSADKKNLHNQEGILKCKDSSPLHYLENVSIQKHPVTGEETFNGIMLNISDRKKVELQLKESNERFANVSRATFDAIWDWDLATNQLYFGEGYQTIFGYNRAKIGRDIREWMDHVHPEDYEKVSKEIHDLMDGSETNWVSEYRYLKADNTYASVLDKFFILRDENGKAIRMIGAMQDITDKKNLEKSIEFERNRIHDLFFHAPTLIGLLKGQDYIFEMANEFCLKVIAKKDVIGKRLTDALPEALNQGFVEILDTVYTTGQSFSASEMLFQVDNEGSLKVEDVYLNLSYQPYRGVDGNIEGIFFFAVDVTEQVVSRKKIELSEVRYRQIVETAQEGIWLIDENNKTTFVNNKMCKILEYSCEEMIGREMYDFMGDNEKEIAKDQMQKKKQGDSCQQKFQYISKAGKEVWANISANPLYHEDGSYKGTLAMMTDITLQMKQEVEILKNLEERELLVAELTRTNKDLKQFSFITSHNFRAPLSNLIALLGLIEHDTLSPNNKEIIEMFKRSTRQLNKTINDLSQILIIKNNVDVKIADINVEVLLEDISSSLNYEISGCRCLLEFDLQVKNIQFNKAYLESILINLISNAIKYRSPHRTLHIKITSALNEKGEVTLCIQDNGLGMDVKRHRESLFGLYQKFHSHTEGSGLGLYIVKSQITSLGGHIEVESEVDGGATFIITLKKKAATVKERAKLNQY